MGTMAEAALASQILVPWGWRWLLGVSALPFGEQSVARAALDWRSLYPDAIPMACCALPV